MSFIVLSSDLVLWTVLAEGWLSVVTIGTSMPLAVANVGSRRRNRKMKLTCCLCSVACVLLLSLCAGRLSSSRLFEAGWLSSFRRPSSAAPFEFEGLTSVVNLLVVSCRLRLRSILILIGALRLQDPCSLISLSIGVATLCVLS